MSNNQTNASVEELQRRLAALEAENASLKEASKGDYAVSFTEGNDGKKYVSIDVPGARPKGMSAGSFLHHLRAMPVMLDFYRDNFDGVNGLVSTSSKAAKPATFDGFLAEIIDAVRGVKTAA